jgi:hypothetical protein
LESDQEGPLSCPLAGLDYLVSSIHAPIFLHALTIFSYIICILASTTLYFVLRNENKRRDALGLGDESERAKLAFQDLTDKENPYFRYVY